MAWAFYISFLFIIIFSIILMIIKNIFSRFVERQVLDIHPDISNDVLSEIRDQISIISIPSERNNAICGSDICPICLESFEYKIHTNCGHDFCGNCFTLYWHVGNFVSAVHCPMCRTNVTLLANSFTAIENDCVNDENKIRLLNEIQCFNRLYSNAPRTWSESIMDIPVIIRHGIRQLFDGNSLSFIHRLRIVVLSAIVIGYCLSPLDIIPQSGFGILDVLDEMLILITFFMYIVIFFRRVVGGGNF